LPDHEILLTAYLVVLLHSFVPHHHHEQSVNDVCCQETSPDQVMLRAMLCAEDGCHHSNESESPCHFDVNPLPGKTLVLSAALITNLVLQQLPVRSEENNSWPEIAIPIPSDPCWDTAYLRGPPAIA